MSLLFRDVEEILQKYSGKCAGSVDNKRFCMRVIYTLANRNGGNFTRQWCLLACNQCFTAPRDLLKIDKIKIGGKVDRVWSEWVNYYDVQGNDWANCQTGVHRLPGSFPVVYDPPRPGFRLMAQPLVKEDEGASFLISGKDIYDRPVYRERDGISLAGEYLSIIKESEGVKPRATRTVFSEVHSITKSLTKNLVRLLYVYEDTKEGFLAGEYLPHESNPAFARYKIPGLSPGCCVELNVFGQVKIPAMYHEYETVPVEDLDLIERVAKEISHESSNEMNLANYMKESSLEAIQRANTRKNEGDESFDFVAILTPRGDEVI
jgi:hypothetical protein